MRFSKIFDFLPPPKFLDMPFAGVAISDTAIRCIKFEKTNKGLHVDKYKELLLNPGVVSSGQVNKKEELKQILADLKKDLDLKYVKVSLPEEKAYLFTAKIPIVKQAEVRGVIESKIEENVPVPGSELVFDYKLIDHRSQGHFDVVVSSFPITVIQTYVEIVQDSGLLPLSLEIESQAIVRAVVDKNNSGTVLVVNFEHDKVGLYVATDRIVRFTSTILFKAELADNTSYLSQEIKKLYTYWHTMKENLDKPEKKISQIILCGENFNEEIISYLSTHNKTTVISSNVWTNVFDINQSVPPISFSDSLKYAAAIGLALSSDTLI